MSTKGILHINSVKKGKEFKAEFVNAKGKITPILVPPTAQFFSVEAAVEGDPVELELSESGQITRCTIPGKEIVHPVVPQKNKQPQPRPSFPVQSVGIQQPAARLATAAYNFIPYDPKKIVGGCDSGELFSGVITCQLTALSPLLVSGEQAKESKRKEFFTVGGKPVIPGTSLKGMLRNLVEMLSFSCMSPVSRNKVFWRTVTGDATSEYKGYFSEKLMGGYLEKQGAQYFLHPVDVKTKSCTAWHLPQKDCDPAKDEVVQTGQMPEKKNDYLFSARKSAFPALQVPVEVFNDFMLQMTPYQLARWEILEPRMTKHGAPVFYRVDEHGDVAELGLARYFRIAYRKAPVDLAGEADGTDFASVLFGSVRGKPARKGRVAVEALKLDSWKPDREYITVLGQPHPSCLAHYLEQRNAKMQTNTSKNYKATDVSTLTNYNDKTPVLRGYKYYWHRDVDVPPLPAKCSEKVQSRLVPLQTGAHGSFSIRVDRVSREELGALLLALQLPEGHAHKLGMGKSLGFGSVRLEVQRVAVSPVAARYTSLAARFLGSHTSMDIVEQDACREAFMRYITAALKETKPYEELLAVRTLRRMMDYQHKPPVEHTRTMELDSKGTGKISFRTRAILPDALSIPDCYTAH